MFSLTNVNLGQLIVDIKYTQYKVQAWHELFFICFYAFVFIYTAQNWLEM